jgi:hypothetical protein
MTVYEDTDEFRAALARYHGLDALSDADWECCRPATHGAWDDQDLTEASDRLLDGPDFSALLDREAAGMRRRLGDHFTWRLVDEAALAFMTADFDDAAEASSTGALPGERVQAVGRIVLLRLAAEQFSRRRGIEFHLGIELLLFGKRGHRAAQSTLQSGSFLDRFLRAPFETASHFARSNREAPLDESVSLSEADQQVHAELLERATRRLPTWEDRWIAYESGHAARLCRTFTNSAAYETAVRRARDRVRRFLRKAMALAEAPKSATGSTPIP